MHGFAHLIQQLADKANALLDRKLQALSDTMDSQMIDLKYGKNYRDEFITNLIKEFS